MSELVFLRAAFSIMVIVCAVSVPCCFALYGEMKTLQRRESWRLRRDEEDGLRSILKRLGGGE